jgi:methyl-accepting chemotaxis protein
VTWLENISVRTKIASAFLLLLALIGALGGFATLQTSRVNSVTVEITRDWMPSVRVLGEIRYFVARHRANLPLYLLREEGKQKEDSAVLLASILDTIKTKMREYEPLISSSDERALFQEFQGLWGQYNVAIGEVLEAARKGDKDQALALYLKSIGALGRDMENALAKAVDVNDKGAKGAADNAADIYSASRLITWLAVGLSAFLAIAAGFLLTRTVATPVTGMTDAMSRLAKRDMEVQIPAIGRKDEIGKMADAVQVFKDNMIKADAAAKREAEELKAREVRAQKISKLTTDFDSDVSMVLKTVASATTEMQSTASSMTATAEETSRQSTAVAAAAEQASTNVQTVASAAEELSSSISEISRQVSQSARIAAQAVDQANKTNAQVESLAEGAQKIGEVVKLINDIAGQTNLLALNATIEAARAGEAGKGFAVVASEVKSLANQTAKATEEISSQIGSIQTATQDSVRAIQEIGRTIAEINQIATTIASAVEEQGAATQEIARNVQQASKGTGEVTSNISGVSQAATDTGTAASQVLASSSELSKQSETLRGQVEKFLAEVKAA